MNCFIRLSSVILFAMSATQALANVSPVSMPVIQAIYAAKEICEGPLLNKVQSYRSALNERLKRNVAAQRAISQSAFDSLELQMKCRVQVKALQEKNTLLAVKELELNRSVQNYQKKVTDLAAATSENTLALNSNSSAEIEKRISELNVLFKDIENLVGEFKSEEENTGFIKEFLQQRRKFFESAKSLGAVGVPNQNVDALKQTAIKEANGVLSEAANYAKKLIALSQTVKKQISELENTSKAFGTHSNTSGKGAKGLGGP